MAGVGRFSTAASTFDLNDSGKPIAKQSQRCSSNHLRTAKAQLPLPCTTGKQVMRLPKASGVVRLVGSDIGLGLLGVWEYAAKNYCVRYSVY